MILVFKHYLLARPNFSDWCRNLDGLEMGLNELFARLNCRENLNLPEVVWVFPGYNATVNIYKSVPC